MPLNNNELSSFDTFNYTPGLATSGFSGSGVKPPAPEFAPTDFSMGLAKNAQGYDMGSMLEMDNFMSGDFNDIGNGNPAGKGLPGEGFDFSNAMNNFSLGAQGISGLAGAYSAWQQTKLMKEQLALQKGFANRNLANSAITVNRQLDNQNSVAAQLTGTGYGTDAYKAEVAKRYNPVDGSPI